MNYAFPNAPRALSGCQPPIRFVSPLVRRRRLIAVLSEVAACEFVFVAVASYLGAAIYFGMARHCWPEPETYLPAALVMAAIETDRPSARRDSWVDCCEVVRRERAANR